MNSLYNIGIYFYQFFIQFASLFNKKAKLFIEGRKNLFEEASKKINPKDKLIWFHASSLGEFEQGKPIIEQCKIDFPNYKILVTFFSPSGYEQRKDYDTADYIFYLPLDTSKNMKNWIDIVNPDLVILIKYEFWFNLLNQLNNRKISTFVVSATFRPDQSFFKPYGKYMLSILKTIKHFFVQNQESMDLLKKHGINQVSLTGDTRFDRVSELVQQSKSLPFLEDFKNNSFTIVAGSTWSKAEEYFTKYINETNNHIKFILVPHEIYDTKIQELKKTITRKTILYSELEDQKLKEYQVIIIDAIGFLTSVYPYGEIAYVGGAYGTSGIHNILEPATYGKPVFYGPNFNKNPEAKNLVDHKGAMVANDYNEFKATIDNFYYDKELLNKYSQNAKEFIKKNTGATAKTIQYLKEHV